MRIVFFGTPSFAADLLQFLVDQGKEIIAVVTKPDKPQGRSKEPIPSAVKQTALHLNLPLFQPARCSHPDFAPTLENLKGDLFLVVAYGEILKDHILKMPPLGCMNVHASLLPAYRGAAPMQRALMAGEAKTGVTLMEMVKEMDAGDMFATASVDIPLDMDCGELSRALQMASRAPLLQLINTLEEGKSLVKEPQDTRFVTFAAKVEREACILDWNLPALTLHNLVRGANPEPGAWCPIWFGNVRKELKIWKTLPHADANTENKSPVGSMEKSPKGTLFVECGSGRLELLEVQPEGKKRMSCSDWLRGAGAFSIVPI